MLFLFVVVVCMLLVFSVMVVLFVMMLVLKVRFGFGRFLWNVVRMCVILLIVLLLYRLVKISDECLILFVVVSV